MVSFPRVVNVLKCRDFGLLCRIEVRSIDIVFPYAANDRVNNNLTLTTPMGKTGFFDNGTLLSSATI